MSTDTTDPSADEALAEAYDLLVTTARMHVSDIHRVKSAQRLLNSSTDLFAKRRQDFIERAEAAGYSGHDFDPTLDDLDAEVAEAKRF